MSEKVERCKFFLMTGSHAKYLPYYKECKVCPLRNAAGDCINDIMDDHCLKMSEEIGKIWRDYFEKWGQKPPR